MAIDTCVHCAVDSAAIQVRASLDRQPVGIPFFSTEDGQPFVLGFGMGDKQCCCHDPG